MTKNTLQRLLTFFFGVSAFLLVACYLSFARNIIFALTIAAVQVAAVAEASALFAAKGIKVKKTYITFLSLALSVCVYLSPLFAERFLFAESFSLLVLFAGGALGGLASMIPFAFVPAKDFDGLLSSLSASLFVFFYCGLLGACLIYITSCFGQSVAPVITFALMSSGNDSMAWLIGMSFGGKQRGLVAVSPAKSLAGFAGGLAGSLGAALASYYLFPDAGFHSLFSLLLLGFGVGLAVIIGDLLESALKRSAGVKDSGSIILGRGGVLDSFDSLFFSAPLFIVVAFALGFFSPAV